jgi:AcrR family transcriptional regulator
MAVSPPPHLTPRQAEILGVATELFARHGYDAVGMRMIADAVGVRTSSLYHHFAAKQDLLHAISLDVTRDFVDEHLPLLDGPGSFSERLSKLLRVHILYFHEHRLQQAVGRRELRGLTREHFDEVMHYERLYQRRVQKFIADGVEAGEFDVPDPKLAGFLLIDAVNGINGWFRDDGPLDIGTVADHYIDLSRRLLGVRAAGRRRRIRAMS